MIEALLMVILPVFILIGAGYGFTWAGLFPVAGIEGLMRYAQGFAVPALLFSAISRMDLSTTLQPSLFAAFYTGAAVCFGLGILGARYLIGRTWEDAVVIGFACLFSNSVLMGLPLTERAFGSPALLGTYAIVSFHAPFCYGLGITVMEMVRHRGSPPGTALRAIGHTVFHNALVLAIIAGFAVNLTGLPVPSFAMDAIGLLATSALPAALFALGGVLVQYRPEGDSRAIAMVCGLSLIVHPAITWTMGTALRVDPNLFRGAVLTAAMAPGFNAYIFSTMYGRAMRVAASSVLVATALSLLTAWGWLLVLG